MTPQRSLLQQIVQYNNILNMMAIQSLRIPHCAKGQTKKTILKTHTAYLVEVPDPLQQETCN